MSAGPPIPPGGEPAPPARKRSGRSRSKSAGSPSGTVSNLVKPAARAPLQRVDETSAGGLVVDLARDVPHGALIGRTDRKGRLGWSLPKGPREAGESPQQAAVREVAEETGIEGEIFGELGTINYWFVADGRRIDKTVHHVLLR